MKEHNIFGKLWVVDTGWNVNKKSSPASRYQVTRGPWVPRKEMSLSKGNLKPLREVVSWGRKVTWVDFLFFFKDLFLWLKCGGWNDRGCQGHGDKLTDHGTALNSTRFLKKINLLIYFWLSWVLVAAHGLSLVEASGGYSWLRYVGLLRWLLLLQSTGSRCAGFSSCGSQALERRLSSCGTQA